MATAYGGQVGHWRAMVEASVALVDDRTAKVTVACHWCSLGWGFKVRYCSAYVGCEGQSGGTLETFYADSGKGQSVQLLAYSQEFTVARGQADREVQCAASLVMPDYEPGSSYASIAVTVPAVPQAPPAPPTGVAASRQSDSVFYIEWENHATAEAPYASTDVQVREGGGEWGAPAGGSIRQTPAAESATWGRGRANSLYRLRVRAANAAGQSAWAESADVPTTPAAPGSPTASFVASAGRVDLSWARTAPYADACQVQRSADGSSWSAAASPSPSATSWGDADPPEGTAWYRVRYGAGGLWGAWAAVGPVSTYTGADYPTVSITAPDGPVRLRPMAVAWEVGGPDPLASQEVALIVGGAVAESASVGPLARSHYFAAGALPDGGSATVVVSATDSKGLSTTVALDVSADYWPPAPPRASFGAACGGAASISLSAGSGASTSPTSAMRVSRVGADGSEAEVAAGAAPGSLAVDAHPPLNVPLTYRVTAESATGKEASSTVRGYVGARCGYVDFPGGGSFPVVLDPTHTETIERGGEAVDFAGGSPHPVWYPSAKMEGSPSFGFKVRREDYDRLRAAACAADEVWVRDPYGHVWHGHPRWTLSPAAGGRYADVSLDLTVTEVR